MAPQNETKSRMKGLFVKCSLNLMIFFSKKLPLVLQKSFLDNDFFTVVGILVTESIASLTKLLWKNLELKKLLLSLLGFLGLSGSLGSTKKLKNPLQKQIA